MRNQANFSEWLARVGALGTVIILVAFGVGALRGRAATVTPPEPVKLRVEGLAANESFGYSVALDGDLLLVGARLMTVNGQQGQGAAFLFTRDASDPLRFNLLKQLTASDGAAFDEFGEAVAIDGDTLVVGASHADPNDQFDVGAAYVFERNQGGANNWGQTAKLIDANFNEFSEHGYMGESVAIRGDVVVVGAPRNRGRAFLFGRDQGGSGQWGELQVLGPQNYWEGGEFGAAVALDGERIYIGGSRSSMVGGRANAEGAVFVFEHDGTKWQHAAKLAIADADPTTPYGNNSRFGAALSVIGNTVLIGAPAMPIGDQFAVGQVFAFQRDAASSAWALTGTLAASDGAGSDNFGRALWATPAGVFIASSKGSNDSVYFFSGPAMAAAQGAGWTEQYSFSLTENVVGANFGWQIAGDGQALVVGASGYESGRGAVFIYPFADMVNVTPATTATPSNLPTATPTITPTPAPVSALVNRLYLPGVYREAAVRPVQMSGVLTNSATLSGLPGVKLGALVDSLAAPVSVTLAIVGPPTMTLPSGVATRGDYYALAADRDLLARLDNPLILALPIPEGADTAHLGLAVLSSGAAPLDAAGDETEWEILPGLYDAAQARFLAPLAFLQETGSTLALVEHPGLSSPPNGAPNGAGGRVQAADETVGLFTVQCDPTFSFPCTADDERDMAGSLNAVYEKMTQEWVYPRPRLMPAAGTIFGGVEEGGAFTWQPAAGFLAQIKPAGAGHCKRADAYYNQRNGKIVLCLDPERGMDEAAGYALIHEYFHATQYAIPRVWQDENARRTAAWIIEGAAAAAAHSVYATDMHRTDFFELHKVDEKLTDGVWGDANDIEYYTQDFWVTLGQRFGRDISYLRPVLENGGATTQPVADALSSTLGFPFADLYWFWVKNQVFEQFYNLDDVLADACQLNTAVLTKQAPTLFNYHPTENQAYPSPTTFAAVAPLHTQVVEIKFPETTTVAVVQLQYAACDGIDDPTLLAQCRAEVESTLHSNIYVEQEADCQLVTQEGERTLNGITPAGRYFAVVANGDLEAEHAYRIVIESN